MVGIPTTVVTREGFSPVVANAYAGFGFPSEAPVLQEFPNPMFLEGSDLSPLKENIDKIVYGLTTWRPKVAAKGLYPAPIIAVQGEDQMAAVAAMNNLFLKNFWGDGLPLTPPTEAQVKWIMTGTDLPPDTLVAKVAPKGGLATVQSLAVNLALAGGRPEYMPVLIAITQAIAEPRFELPSVSPSTNSNYIAVVVNGPMAKDIRLSSGYGCLGPDSAHPAGGAIGRALALILQNLGGAIPGMGAMELYGGMRYTNAVFAEDELGLPKGWDPLSLERGFKKGDNVVTALPVSGAVNINIMYSDFKDSSAAAQGYLYRIARTVGAPNLNAMSAHTDHSSPDFAPGILFLPRTWAMQWSTLGWDKLKVKGWLRENTKLTWPELKKLGMSLQAKASTGASETQPAYMAPKDEGIKIVIAGGAQSAHAYWMPVGKATNMISAPIKLPANWKSLIKASEDDLGAIPAN